METAGFLKQSNLRAPFGSFFSTQFPTMFHSPTMLWNLSLLSQQTVQEPFGCGSNSGTRGPQILVQVSIYAGFHSGPLLWMDEILHHCKTMNPEEVELRYRHQHSKIPRYLVLFARPTSQPFPVPTSQPFPVPTPCTVARTTSWTTWSSSSQGGREGKNIGTAEKRVALKSAPFFWAHGKDDQAGLAREGGWSWGTLACTKTAIFNGLVVNIYPCFASEL